MKKLRIAARIICFIAVFCLAWALVQHVISYKWDTREHLYDRYGHFEAEPAGSIDVLYFGTSYTLDAINPTVIYNEIGATGYNFSKTNNFSFSHYYELRYALRHQKPSLVVLDLCDIGGDRETDLSSLKITSLHKAIENMPDWDLRLEMILACERAYHLGLSDMMGNLLPLLRYHDRWQELTAGDFSPDAFHSENYRDYIKGAHMIIKTVDLSGTPLFMDSGTIEEAPISEFYLDKILALCRGNDIEVLAVTIPRTKVSCSYQHNAQAWCERNGVPQLTYPDEEALNAIGIRLDSSYYNTTAHLNVQGQLAYSRALAGVMKAWFQLEDHRGDPAYAAWDDAYDTYVQVYGPYLPELLTDGEQGS